MNNLILCGHKACGKTTFGKMLAHILEYQFIDTDQEIIRAYGKAGSIRDVYEALGESAFRALEAEVIQAIGDIDNTVIATGGGAVFNPQTVVRLKALGRIVYLKVAPEILEARWKKLSFSPKVMQERDKLYQAVADVVVTLEDKDGQ